ncbi:2004fb03-f6f7-4017-b246-c612e1ccf1b6 [Thermothielavioides terrestris]|nr:2004fb03-f6f7-4017-b246-c612e1ccf1b6 [Thermothielavioides terrestris]
MEGGGY